MGRSRQIRLLAAAVIAVAAVVTCAASVSDRTFRSAALDRAVPYRVILPDDYDTTSRRYPVLYLLHGYGGAFSNWSDKTGVATYAAGHPLIIVMPEGANSWYVDAAAGSQSRNAWETYLTSDLVAEVDRSFRTVATRDGRMIAGLSMGGYGAIKAGLKHPELYALVGSFSGALDITRAGDVFHGEQKADVMRIFGPIGGDARKANDVYALAAGATPERLPYFWIGCGTDDPWLEPNREMARTLKSHGVKYEYHERPGGHDWTFWDWAIKALLADPHLAQ
jgi:S-formylglutathione hydrolase FrmB